MRAKRSISGAQPCEARPLLIFPTGQAVFGGEDQHGAGTAVCVLSRVSRGVSLVEDVSHDSTPRHCDSKSSTLCGSDKQNKRNGGFCSCCGQAGKRVCMCI